jgi:hypothetical protein
VFTHPGIGNHQCGKFIICPGNGQRRAGEYGRTECTFLGDDLDFNTGWSICL